MHYPLLFLRYVTLLDFQTFFYDIIQMNINVPQLDKCCQKCSFTVLVIHNLFVLNLSKVVCNIWLKFYYMSAVNGEKAVHGENALPFHAKSA